MTALPLWAVYLVAFGTPLSALVGVLVGQWLARRTAREADSRSRREELMRNLRWAAELAAGVDERKAELGVAQLTALGESDLLDPADQPLVDAALSAVIRGAQEVIDEMAARGVSADVVEDVGDAATGTDEVEIALPSMVEHDAGEEVRDGEG